MLNRYKEIFYGLLLGVGAWVIDGAMPVQEEGGSFWGELVHVHSRTLLYRTFFIAFGLAVGWLLWTGRGREREFRRLTEIYKRFHHEVADPAFLNHTKCEELLWLNEADLPAKTRESVRFVTTK